MRHVATLERRHAPNPGIYRETHMADKQTTGMSELERAWVRVQAERHYHRTRGEPRPGLREAWLEAWLWVDDLWCRTTGP